MSISQYIDKMEMPDADKTRVQKFSPSPIRFGIDAEIERALKIYGNDESYFSKTHWPFAFRVLVSSILKSVLDKPDIWKELGTSDFEVNEELLCNLIEELKLSTSQFIKIKQRKWIIHVLRMVSLFRKKFQILSKLPKLCNLSSDWPNDLEDKDDFSGSLTDESLRGDVRNFFWNLLKETIPATKYCNMHYFGTIGSVDHRYPIVIEVPETFVALLKDRIETVSDRLRSANYENLRPVDVVLVKGVPDRELAAPIEGV